MKKIRISSQAKKLREKIEKEREHKKKQYDQPIVEIKPKISRKRQSKEEKKKELMNDLDFFKKLLRMIEKGATGFDLAYEVEKNRLIKKLMYDGIIFYNNFIEIGNKKFIDLPDKKKVNYKAFRTIEDTEKYIFMIWLKEQIAKREKKASPKEEYEKYLKGREKALITHCLNCGARFINKSQKICEKCGENR